MAKSTTAAKTTSTVTHKTINPASKVAKSSSTGRIVSVQTSGRTGSKDSNSAGVVAYTKGSRFKDADVLAVVKRVLGQS